MPAPGTSAGVVDLHLHTTISDGRLTPTALVARAARERVRVMAVTDHDTTLATSDVADLARASGIEPVSGIEVTAVEDGRDVHILGYFLDHQSAALSAFLARQRLRRIERVGAIAERLASLGMPVQVDETLQAARREPGRSIGRPDVARAMQRAGHVADLAEAFEKWLGFGRPAFVPREGPDCEAVIAAIHEAGGLASLAHPGKTGIDPRIPALCASGLDAIEAFHPDHPPAEVRRYVRLAGECDALVTGGSDFHGDPSQLRAPGSCPLPDVEWARLEAAARRHA